MSGFKLADPSWLFAVALVLGVLWLERATWRRRRVLFSSSLLFAGAPTSLAQRLASWLPALRALGLLCLVVALARPQRGLEEFRVRTEGIAILFCLDRSGSMRAMDFEQDGRRQDRLEVAKQTFASFVEGEGELAGRPDDWIGLVAFGGYAESLCPLTLDHGALLAILKDVAVPSPVTDEQGRILDREFSELEQQTAIGDAIARGSDLLRNAPAKSRVLILLSDGENTAGIDPLAAAKAAAELGIRIHSIGIGSTGQAPFPVEDRTGRVRLVPQLVRLDARLLTEVAETTGGRFFQVQDTGTLREVYEQIDQLEKTEAEGLVYTRYRELYAPPLLAGIVLVLLERILAATRLRRLP